MQRFRQGLLPLRDPLGDARETILSRQFCQDHIGQYRDQGIPEEAATEYTRSRSAMSHVLPSASPSGKIVPPEWAGDVKTGMHRQLPPAQPDWWYTRCASILRRIYIDGPVGVQRLRSLYGGRRNRGVRPDRHERASGAIIRNSAKGSMVMIGTLFESAQGSGVEISVKAATHEGHGTVAAVTVRPRRFQGVSIEELSMEVPLG